MNSTQTVVCIRRTVLPVLLFFVLSFSVLTGCGKSEQPPEAVAPSPPAVELSDAEITARFKKIWFANSLKDGMMKSKYLGTLTWQNPFDVWITQEIMYEVKPDVIVEAGTFKGGSAVLWATFLTQINPKGRVITIDIKDVRAPEAVNHPLAKRMVTFLQGNSSGPKVVAQVRKALVGKRALFILDSLHTRAHVLSELRAYGDMVPVGSYIIVQDTIGTGALAGINDFLKENKNFEADRSQERLMITNNAGGYLKRIR